MSSARLEYLKKQLKHPLPTIRYNAVRALGEMHNTEIIGLLREIKQNDASEGVRQAAAVALDELLGNGIGHASTD